MPIRYNTMGTARREGHAMDISDQREASQPRALTRRGFIGLAATAAGSALVRSAGSYASESDLVMPADAANSRVVRIQSKYLVGGAAIHETLLGEMVERLLTTLTHTGGIKDAWHAVLRPEDVVGIKFNRSGQAALGTTPAVAGILIRSLLDAGWRPDRIVCIEAPDEVRTKYGTALPKFGYSRKAFDFGSGSDQLSSVLEQITALINVPYLKTHNIAVMTSALKNLSHGFVKHPARYHANGCSPYVADIAALDAIRGKLRLTLVDAIRVVYRGGPEASASAISPEGSLLASLDAVAVDTVGFGMLNSVRERANLPKIAKTAGDVPYLAAAHRRGLGIALVHGIDVTDLPGV